MVWGCFGGVLGSKSFAQQLLKVFEGIGVGNCTSECFSDPKKGVFLRVLHQSGVFDVFGAKRAPKQSKNDVKKCVFDVILTSKSMTFSLRTVKRR